MKFKIEFEIEEIGKNFYYFSICGIPYRVWKEKKKWFASTYDGMDCYAYDTMREAIEDTVLIKHDNSERNYKNVWRG